MVEGYYLEGKNFRILQELERQLFGDGSTLHPDKRRDMANTLHVVLNEIENSPIDDTAEKALEQVAYARSYIGKITKETIGGGDEPVKFLCASHETMLARFLEFKKNMKNRLEEIVNEVKVA